MGFKTSLTVLCLLIYCLGFIEGANKKEHEKYKHKDLRAFKYDKDNKESRIRKEDRLQPIRLTRLNHKQERYRNASNRDAGNEIDVEGGFNLNFNNIIGGAGIQMIYDNLKNIFMAVNRVLKFGFIWDGISGFISLFNIDTGATFVINAVTRMGGFVGYMLIDVRILLREMTADARMLVTSSLDLLQTSVRFAVNNASNLVVNMLDLVNALLGLTKQNLQDILGTVYKVVYSSFKSLFDGVGMLSDSVGNGLMAILQPMLGNIRFVTNPIVKILCSVLRTAGGLFDNNLFRAINEGLNGVLQHVEGGVVGGVKEVAGGIFGAVAGAINGVGTVFQDIGDAIGSIVFHKDEKQDNLPNDTIGYTNIETTTIVDDEPIQFTYMNTSDEYCQHFIRQGHKNADVIILYKGGKDNFFALYNRLKKAVFILSGNKGHIGIFNIENGAGIYFKPNSTIGYAIQPPGFLRADFQGPTAKNVSAAITKLSRSLDEFSRDIHNTVDVVTFDIIEVLRTISLKNLLSSILTGEVLMVVARLFGNFLHNLAEGFLPMIRPSLGIANTLIPFILNLPTNFINGIINLIGNVVKRFLGLFVPDFLAELAKIVVIAALKGLTGPMLAPTLTPIEAASQSINLGLTAVQTAVDLLHLA